MLDTAAPRAQVELIKNSRTAFSTFSDATKLVCSEHGTDIRPLTESHEMETEDKLFGNVHLFFTDSPYNVQRKAKKANFKHDLFSWEDIRDLVELCLKVMALCAQGYIFCSWLQLGR